MRDLDHFYQNKGLQCAVRRVRQIVQRAAKNNESVKCLKGSGGFARWQVFTSVSMQYNYRLFIGLMDGFEKSLSIEIT